MEKLGISEQENLHYIQAIFNDEKKRNIFSLHVTGGGVSTLQWMFTVPGASRTLKSATIPYSRSALLQLINPDGKLKIGSFCSSEVAVKLAEEAYRNTVESILLEEPAVLAQPETLNIFGVGCSAALATSVPKRGDHRCHIAIYNGKKCLKLSVILDKEVLSREEEDMICSKIVLDLIGRHCSFPPLITEESFRKHYRLESSTEEYNLQKLIDNVIANKESTVFFPSLQTVVSPSQWITLSKGRFPRNSLVFPGSFNPLHDGHLKLIETAADDHSALMTGETIENKMVIFEITILNVDKPVISTEEIIKRLNQFHYQANPLLVDLFQRKKIVAAVAITPTPRFIDKSFVFPNAAYIIGADTLERLLEVRYYKDSHCDQLSGTEAETYTIAKIVQAMGILNQNGCRFIVGGRIEQKKGADATDNAEVQFQTLSTICQANPVANIILKLYPSLFHQVGEDKFREDISSSELRKALAEKGESGKA